MRAVVKLTDGPGNVAVTDRDVPVPGPEQVLVEVTAAGICGTDLHIVDAVYPSRPPVTLGHEVTGIVWQLGAGVDASWLGSRVACETFFSTCGTCRFCREGRPNLCTARLSIGSGVDGGFARYVLVRAGQLHPVPKHVADDAAALCEPLACVCQSLGDRPTVQCGDNVVVLGPGPVGLLAAQVARASGAEVMVVGTERDAGRLDKAEELGFRVRAVTGGGDAGASPFGDVEPDVVIECSGSGAAMAAGMTMVRRRGHYVQIGQGAGCVPVPMTLVSLKELSLSGGFASTPRSWHQAMLLLEKQQVELEPLVSEVAPLEDWERLFAQCRAAVGVKHLLVP